LKDNGGPNFQDKKRETEELLGTGLAEERFALLVNLGKKINDFGSRGSNDDEENIDETYGINVQFQGSNFDLNYSRRGGFRNIFRPTFLF
jgi:pre-mRNA-splicing helicase BRR2